MNLLRTAVRLRHAAAVLLAGLVWNHLAVTTPVSGAEVPADSQQPSRSTARVAR